MGRTEKRQRPGNCYTYPPAPGKRPDGSAATPVRATERSET